jgi:hypothetical protein
LDVPAGAVALEVREWLWGSRGRARSTATLDYRGGERENYKQSPPPTDFTMDLRRVEWEFRNNLKFKHWGRQIFGCRRDQILNFAMVQVII